MIGYLKGKVLENFSSEQLVIIEINGVGWEVNFTSDSLPGEETELYIYTQSDEKQLALWGFKQKADKSLFINLIKVNGVGVRTAHRMITELGSENIISSILNSDDKAIKVKGIGEKTRKKIILDLKDKLAKTYNLANLFKKTALNNSANTYLQEDIQIALEMLGYSEKEILKSYNKLVQEIGQDEFNQLETDKVIKLLLKNF